MKLETSALSQDPALTRLLERMPDSVAQSFSDEQLMHLRNAVAAREWGSHSVDIRGVLTIPMLPWRFYYVLLAGRNRRLLTSGERQVSVWLSTLFLTLFLVFSALLGLLVLYLLKSAVGVDLFPGFSLGIWAWFKDAFL